MGKLMQLKIKLDEIKPDIWRRFIIDSSFTLSQLHEVIQIVMGWENYHLYEFDIHGEAYGIPNDEYEIFGVEMNDCKKTKIEKLNLKPKDKFTYTYDMGDDWRHKIIVEKITQNEEVSSPMCIEGARNCPPEDCGSIPGYEDIVNAMNNPKSKEAKELIEWLGGIYDPEIFHIETINEELNKKWKYKKKKN
jgi:hypothetical protein